MTNYTFEEKQIAIKILKDLMSHEVECTRKLFGAFNSHLHAVPSNLIREKIKALKTLTFGDIKNQVGTQFKNEIFEKQVLIISKDTHNNPRIYNLSKSMILDKYFSLSDDAQVEVINETETTSKSGG